MPHIHSFMQQQVVDAHLTKTTTGFMVDRSTSIEWLVAQTVKEAFLKHTGRVLDDDQIVRYDLRVTNSMPVDMAVNVTAWYTPERAPHFKAIEREVAEKLAGWAPRLDIQVHLVVIGAPQFSSLDTGTRSLGSQLG